MCVFPSDTTKCFPGFYTTEASLGILFFEPIKNLDHEKKRKVAGFVVFSQ